MRRVSVYSRNKNVKMNIENLVFILQHDIDANRFLYVTKESDNMTLQDTLFIEILSLIAENKFSSSGLEQIITLHNTEMPEIKKTLQQIITDYNTIYLDDKYFHGYWKNAICYEDKSMKTIIPLPTQ